MIHAEQTQNFTLKVWDLNLFYESSLCTAECRCKNKSILRIAFDLKILSGHNLWFITYELGYAGEEMLFSWTKRFRIDSTLSSNSIRVWSVNWLRPQSKYEFSIKIQRSTTVTNQILKWIDSNQVWHRCSRFASHLGLKINPRVQKTLPAGRQSAYQASNRERHLQPGISKFRQTIQLILFSE